MAIYVSTQQTSKARLIPSSDFVLDLNYFSQEKRHCFIIDRNPKEEDELAPSFG